MSHACRRAWEAHLGNPVVPPSLGLPYLCPTYATCLHTCHLVAAYVLGRPHPHTLTPLSSPHPQTPTGRGLLPTVPPNNNSVYTAAT